MKNHKQGLTCDQARAIDIVDYLAKAGFHPQRIRDHNYWYLSPLRNERTASFKVNRRINRWYDHGIGKGGNLVDFALLYHNCKIGEWLQGLGAAFLPHAASARKEGALPQKAIIIREAGALTSRALISYLQSRNISLSAASLFCVEVQYEFQGRTYFGIGFKNDREGYEIRNPYYKNSSSPKGIRTIKKNAGKVAVFEGFFDFLSFICMTSKDPQISYSFCILNSLSFFEMARPFLEQHTAIHLFLDKDSAGKNCTRYAVSLDKKYLDCSNLYKGFKDYNEWWMTRQYPP